MSPAARDLHDATFLKAHVNWAERTVVLEFDTADGPLRMSAAGVTDLAIPHHEPWGPSVSVNELRSVSGRTEIEMQSGDVIVLAAAQVRFDD